MPTAVISRREAVSAAARPAGRFAVSRTPAEWRRMLGSSRYAILRASATKFESGTGWPSFFRALPNSVATRIDPSLGMKRTEALCRRCGGTSTICSRMVRGPPACATA